MGRCSTGRSFWGWQAGLWEPYGEPGPAEMCLYCWRDWLPGLGTCAVFYTLFLCRMLGAGDIKLMALCTGLLGMGPGLLVIFTGLFLAALRAAGMIWQQGSLWMRMERIGTFIIRSGREGKLLEYPGREDKRNILRLGPWLFLVYCIWLAGRYL